MGLYTPALISHDAFPTKNDVAGAELRDAVIYGHKDIDWLRRVHYSHGDHARVLYVNHGTIADMRDCSEKVRHEARRQLLWDISPQRLATAANITPAKARHVIAALCQRADLEIRYRHARRRLEVVR